MNTKFSLIVMLTILNLSLATYSQNISGQVKTINKNEKHEHQEGLPGANVFWLNTNIGTVTDNNGQFALKIADILPNKLVISYVGFIPDTIFVSDPNQKIEVVLRENRELSEVTISGHKVGAHYSRSATVLTNVLTDHELQKAACCNLAEAFETNASVDITYSDAITGAKQIQLLGLTGIYSQILTENVPSLQGLGQPFGLTYIPGPWMESIQIAKGTSSVVNGFDAITGQINVELKKPENSELFGLNAYANNFGRLENSLIFSKMLNYRWSTMIMSHVEYLGNKFDHNDDGFLDHPLIKKYHITNRYQYEWHGRMESQFGFRFIQEERQGGQKEWFSNPNLYGVDINTNRFEAQAKTGFFFPNQPEASLGTQFSYVYHNQSSMVGRRNYDATQNRFYTNIIYEDIIKSKKHQISTGVSFLFDQYNEDFDTLYLSRTDQIPGIFGQYTFHHHEHFSGILGLRLDHHNKHGLFFTPRVHLRSNITEHTTVRGSIGKGYHLPNLLAENSGIMISNRQFKVNEDIKPEQAWNYGLNLTQHFMLFENESSIAAEFYRTQFENQLIVDVDSDPHQVQFYNLKGKSFANNYQLELKTEPLTRLELTAAIRVTDVKTTINDTLQRKPFVNRYKGLFTGSWQTYNRRWQFDATIQLNGKSRIPSTTHLPAEMQLPTESPAYTVINNQITYRIKSFDMYLGVENLTDFKQHHPIIGASDPFGNNFDASMLWGPIMGRTIYIGLRYKI